MTINHDSRPFTPGPASSFPLAHPLKKENVDRVFAAYPGSVPPPACPVNAQPAPGRVRESEPVPRRWRPLALTVAALAWTYSAYDAARLAAEGGRPRPVPFRSPFHRDISRLHNEFSIWLSQQIGLAGLLMLGGLLVILCLWWVYWEWFARDVKD